MTEQLRLSHCSLCVWKEVLLGGKQEDVPGPGVTGLQRNVTFSLWGKSRTLGLWTLNPTSLSLLLF